MWIQELYMPSVRNESPIKIAVEIQDHKICSMYGLRESGALLCGCKYGRCIC